MRERNGGQRLVSVVLAAALVLAVSPGIWAGHTPGSLTCNDCHTMHNESGTPTARLLLDSVTDACLGCHLEGSVGDDGTAPIVWQNAGTYKDLPGGDYENIESATTNGHTLPSTAAAVVVADGATAPGGTYDATTLKCTSCHNSHGNSNFRNLLSDPNGDSTLNAIVAGTDAWETAGIDRTTWEAGSGETSTKHNGYKQEFSRWCAECHGDYHTAANQTAEPGPYILHPTADTVTPDTDQGGIKDAAMAAAYTATYNPVVPYEDSTVAAADANTNIAVATSKVFCLTCHRAHASAYTNATRWDVSATADGTDDCSTCHNK